jgi:chromosome segregation ATPase
MNLDGLPEQFEEFVERARAALDRDITAAKNLVTAANAEKAAAETALRELVEQRESAKKQLDRVFADLSRGSSLVGLNHEITAARKVLATLQADTERATAAKAVVERQCVDGERRLVSLNNEAQRMIAIRTEGEAVMADLRTKLHSVQLGNRP